MAYARIRLNFEAMGQAYRDYKSLPPDIQKWIDDQNAREDKVNTENRERKEQGLPPLPGGGHSTTCCMQASLSFNAVSPIPKTGTRKDRDNTPLNGKNYILTVDEFRAYLTYKYGPTDQVADLAAIAGKKGVLLFGGAHIELWDGENIFQSAGGAKRRAAKKWVVNPSAVMGGAILSAKPRWFWEINDSAATSTVAVPEWLVGWWVVYDGNYYYYYFYHDGHVSFIETKPNPKWVPPKTIGNQGTLSLIPNGFSVVWTPTEPGGTPTKEDFTRLNWTSTIEMNATSNKYSPLYARKM